MERLHADNRPQGPGAARKPNSARTPAPRRRRGARPGAPRVGSAGGESASSSSSPRSAPSSAAPSVPPSAQPAGGEVVSPVMAVMAYPHPDTSPAQPTPDLTRLPFDATPCADPAEDDLFTSRSGVVAREPADALARAAYPLAVAWGQRRLFPAAEDADAGPPLATMIALPAARDLNRRVRLWARHAQTLPARVSGVAGLRSEPLLVAALLRARMEAWAAYLAVDAAYSAALRVGDRSADRLGEAIDDVLEGMDSFDAALQSVESSLARALPRDLLRDWRKALAPPHRDVPPWWLDGTLETLAERVGRERIRA